MSTSFISAGKEILIHNEDEAEPLANFNIHKDDATYAILNHNSYVFASGGSDGLINLYHIANDGIMMTLAEEDSTVN